MGRAGGHLTVLQRLRLITGALVVAALAIAPALSKEKQKHAPKKLEFTKSEHILKWINDYRANPEPDKLPDVVHAMGDLGLFRDLDSAGVYVGFMGGVLGANPEKADRIVRHCSPCSLRIRWC
jgi:hypothetical protein